MRASITIIFPAKRPDWMEPAASRAKWSPMIRSRWGWIGSPFVQNWAKVGYSSTSGTWWRW